MEIRQVEAGFTAYDGDTEYAHLNWNCWSMLKQLMTFIFLLLVSISGVSAQGLPTHVTTLTWNHDGTLLAIGYGHVPIEPCYQAPEPYGIRLLNPDGTLNQELKRHVCTVTSLTFSPHGSQLISADDGGLIVTWDVATGEIVDEQVFELGIEEVAWRPTGKDFMVWTYGIDITVTNDDYQTPRSRLIPGDTRGENYTDTSWSPDGRDLAISSEDGSIRIWNTNIRNEIASIFQGHTDPVRSVAWNPTGDTIASGDSSGPIYIWEPFTNEVVETFADHSDAIVDLSWSPDGKLLVSASADGTIRFWDVDKSEEIKRIKSDDPVTALEWSPQGDQLAYGGMDTITQEGWYEILDLDFSVR
jgi:WD40 repeat protein